MKMKIKRYEGNDKQTLGELFIRLEEHDLVVFTASYQVDYIFKCYTLELPDLDNEKFISSIPKGKYKCRYRWSIKYGHHIIVEDVDGREWILIHAGNFFFNTKGCILVGDSLRDINGDGILDVVNSKQTLKKILSIVPERFSLVIE